MNIIPMIAALVPLLILGLISARHRPASMLAMIAAVAFLYMAMSRGFYWNIFGRGHGFWTANRVSALATFAVAYFGPRLFICLNTRNL